MEDNSVKATSELKKWETPVFKSEDFGSTLGGHHVGMIEALTGTMS